jgi:hypothetical protein
MTRPPPRRKSKWFLLIFQALRETWPAPEARPAGAADRAAAKNASAASAAAFGKVEAIFPSKRRRRCASERSRSAIMRNGGPKRPSISFLFLPFRASIRELSMAYGRKARKISFFPPFHPSKVGFVSRITKTSVGLAPSQEPQAPSGRQRRLMLHPCFHASLALGAFALAASRLEHNMNTSDGAREMSDRLRRAPSGLAPARGAGSMLALSVSGFVLMEMSKFERRKRQDPTLFECQRTIESCFRACYRSQYLGLAPQPDGEPHRERKRRPADRHGAGRGRRLGRRSLPRHRPLHRA